MKKKPTNKDYGRRLYVSDEDYQVAMRRVPNKAMWNENLIKQSEFEKPYRSNSETYEEMQYNYPDFSFPDYNSPQPNADVEGEVPGTDLYNYGLVHCFGDLCYCPGQHICWPISCTYPLVKAWFEDCEIGVSFTQNQICFDASPDVFGSCLLHYDLQLIRIKDGKLKKSITHLSKYVSECDSSLCCGCEGISIGYTTQQMEVSTQQTLTVIGATEGCTYNWAIASGGGSLSSGTGTSVVYTAPATNAECDLNPTITLSAGGAQCGLLKIAVNAVSGSSPATASKTMISCTVYPTYFDCWVHILTLNCNGTVYYDDNGEPCDYDAHAICGRQYTWDPCYGGSCATCYTYAGESKDEYGNYALCKIGSGSALGTIDIRTAAQKTAGCCPAALL